MYFVLEAKFSADSTDYPKGVSSHTQRLGSVTTYNGRLGTRSQMAHLLDIRLKAMASVLRAVIIVKKKKLVGKLKERSCLFSVSLRDARNSKALACSDYFKRLLQLHRKDLWCLIPVFSVYILIQGAGRWMSVQIWACLCLALACRDISQAKTPTTGPSVWLMAVGSHSHWACEGTLAPVSKLYSVKLSSCIFIKMKYCYLCSLTRVLLMTGCQDGEALHIRILNRQEQKCFFYCLQI